MSYNHENLIVGCGNILFGDDGFGPKVIEYMKENNVEIPGDTCLIDGGTSAPHYIFTLPQDKWKNIIKLFMNRDISREGNSFNKYGSSWSQ